MTSVSRDGSVVAVIRGGVLLFVVLCVSGALRPVGAQVSAFLEISGVRGDATESGHGDWLEILSFQHAISGAPDPMSTGATVGGSSTGRAMMGEISIVKEVDKSRPSLMDACTQGSQLPEVTIHVTDTSGGKHLVYELEKVAVVRYRILSAGDSALRRYVGITQLDRSTRLEEVTFGYGRVNWGDAGDDDDDEDDWRR